MPYAIAMVGVELAQADIGTPGRCRGGGGWVYGGYGGAFVGAHLLQLPSSHISFFSSLYFYFVCFMAAFSQNLDK